MRALALLLIGAALVEHGAAESCDQLRQDYLAANFDTVCNKEGNVCSTSAFSLDGRSWSWGTCTSSAQVCSTAKAVLESSDTCTQTGCEVSCVAPVGGRCADFQCSAAANAHGATSAVAVAVAVALVAALAGRV